MKREVVGLILISYVLMACGNLLEAGCCRNAATHAAGTHTAHEHAHSKVLVAVHGLLHESVPGGDQISGKQIFRVSRKPKADTIRLTSPLFPTKQTPICCRRISRATPSPLKDSAFLTQVQLPGTPIAFTIRHCTHSKVYPNLTPD